MLGVVLAAGDATRMPNKLMLMAPNHNAIIVDSIEYCLRHCDYVDVIIKDHETALEHYLLACYPDYRRLRIRRQKIATGAVDAINCASSTKNLLVAFGDCYGYQNLPVPGPNQATCIAGSVPGLDGYRQDSKSWVNRDIDRCYSFSGSFRVDDWGSGLSSLMHRFNKLKVTPLVCPQCVQDCGTPEGYLKIWQQ